MLSSLYRDDRSPSLSSFPILSKMFLENVIRPAEVAEFARELQPHQVARLPSVKGLVVDDSEDEDASGGMAVDGGEKRSERIGPETVLDRAVMEHNLLSCSKVRRAGSSPRALFELTCGPTASSTSTSRLPASAHCSTLPRPAQSSSPGG